MFEHLVGLDIPASGEYAVPDPTPAKSFDDASVQEVVNAQANTLAWLDELGAYTGEPNQPVPTCDEAAAAAARAAFCSVTDPYQDPLKAKSALLAMHAPPAVRHLAGMLSQYDWAFVNQAKEIRGYIVARLVEHSQNKDPKYSLAALKALGTITEIGAFTERIEITRPPSEATPDALVERLREKLKMLMPPSARVEPVEDATVIEAQ